METIDVDYLYKKPLSPLLKWPGGKTDDWTHIMSDFPYLLPKNIDRYYEPFLGGGAVWLSVLAKKMHVNDLCQEVIHFYELIRDQDDNFFGCINRMSQNWDLFAKIGQENYVALYSGTDKEKIKILQQYRKQLENEFFAPDCGGDYFDTIVKSLLSKIENIRKVENKKGQLSNDDLSQNIEGALKAGFYTVIRGVYNNHKKIDFLKVACFYFLRDYCYSSMFRYNSSGGFNVPYGGMSYNSRSPASRVEYWRNPDLLKHLQATSFYKLDFEVFLQKTKPSANDFIFVDPPYDSEFSTYAQNTFGADEQRRLADYLINKCDARFLAIMKNTDLIRGLYSGKGKGVQCFTYDKTYAVSFKDRNNREVEHLVVARL